MSYVEVTDKNFKMDKFLVKTMHDCKKRIDAKWDIAIAVDGDEGCGKSNLAIGAAYYMAWQLGKKLTVDNIFFDINKLMNFAATARKEVLVFDEAALGVMSSDFQNQAQKKLIKMLITSRKNGNIFFFVMPEFFGMNKYVAYHRTIGLLHAYSPDGISRGSFTWHGKSKKNATYLKCKKGEKTYKNYNYVGSFPQGYENLIDYEAYERKKDKAILSICDGTEKVDHNLQKLEDLKYLISNCPLCSQKDMATYLGVTDRTLRRWKTKNSKSEESGIADLHSKKPTGGELI